MSLSDEQFHSLLNHPESLVVQVAAEALRLRQAINEHQSQTGHHLCWLNDVQLWRAVNPSADYPHETLPIQEEFLTQCARYYRSRVEGTPYEEPQPQCTVTRKKDDRV